MIEDIRELKKQIMSQWGHHSADGLCGSTVTCKFCGVCESYHTESLKHFKHNDNCAILLIQRIEQEAIKCVDAESKVIILNDLGLAVWKSRYFSDHFIERAYSRFDRIVEINETGDGRKIVDVKDFGSFDFTDWEPMTKEEYALVKKQYKEIYNYD